jgi:hypothetical protein
MTRAQIFAAFKAAGVITNDGLAMRKDEEVEQLYFTWLKADSPRGAHVRIDFATLYIIDPPDSNEPPELET